MQWEDQGVILDVRTHGEHAAIVQLLTREHGRHAGLVQGAQGRRLRGVVMPGRRMAVRWSGRLEDQLGRYDLEPLDAGVFDLYEDALKLDVLENLLQLAACALPERETQPGLHDGLVALLEIWQSPENWPETALASLVRWELELLDKLGYGLDLSRCAATGCADGLSHISPKSGRALCGAAEEVAAYRDRLLPLPPFLLGQRRANLQDVLDGLALTGYFLQRRVFDPLNKALPEARLRLIRRVTQEIKHRATE